MQLLERNLEAMPKPAQSAGPAACPPGAVVGELLAIIDAGCTALVAHKPDMDSAPLRARVAMDLHATHIGRPVVLVFENGDPARPIVTGVLRAAGCNDAQTLPAQVDVDADGERLVVTARNELVLRCGKAMLTLRRDGSVELQGETILTRASGANRIQGGSVQMN